MIGSQKRKKLQLVLKWIHKKKIKKNNKISSRSSNPKGSWDLDLGDDKCFSCLANSISIWSEEFQRNEFCVVHRMGRRGIVIWNGGLVDQCVVAWWLFRLRVCAHQIGRWAHVSSFLYIERLACGVSPWPVCHGSFCNGGTIYEEEKKMVLGIVVKNERMLGCWKLLEVYSVKLDSILFCKWNSVGLFFDGGFECSSARNLTYFFYCVFIKAVLISSLYKIYMLWVHQSSFNPFSAKDVYICAVSGHALCITCGIDH